MGFLTQVFSKFATWLWNLSASIFGWFYDAFWEVVFMLWNWFREHVIGQYYDNAQGTYGGVSWSNELIGICKFVDAIVPASQLIVLAVYTFMFILSVRIIRWIIGFLPVNAG